MTVILASMIFKPRSIICAHGCAKVGTIGFCLGGRMVYLAACRTDADAHASYYGVGIETLLDEADQITAPTLIHIAAKDEWSAASAGQNIRYAGQSRWRKCIYMTNSRPCFCPSQWHALRRRCPHWHMDAPWPCLRRLTLSLISTRLCPPRCSSSQKNSSLFLVFFNLSMRNSAASTAPIGLRIRRRT